MASFGNPTDMATQAELDGEAALRVSGDALAILKAIVDVKGDLLVATAADTVARLAAGGNGQTLVADSAEVAGVKWATPYVLYDVLGDILIGSGPDSATKLSVGTNNQLLVADSAAASGVRWGTFLGASNEPFRGPTDGSYDAKVVGDLKTGIINWRHNGDYGYLIHVTTSPLTPDGVACIGVGIDYDGIGILLSNKGVGKAMYVDNQATASDNAIYVAQKSTTAAALYLSQQAAGAAVALHIKADATATGAQNLVRFEAKAGISAEFNADSGFINFKKDFYLDGEFKHRGGGVGFFNLGGTGSAVAKQTIWGPKGKAAAGSLLTAMTAYGLVTDSSSAEVVTKTAAYTALAGETVLANVVTAPFTVTLPAAPVIGAEVTVKKIDVSVNAVTVVGSGVTTIDGDPSAVLLTQWVAATFIYIGTNWLIKATARADVIGGPLGILGIGEATADQVGIDADVDLTNVTTTVTVQASRRVKVTASLFITGSANNVVAAPVVYEDGVAIQQFRLRITDSTVAESLERSVIRSPAAGTHTYKVKLQRAGAAGTLTSMAAASYKAFILVEDIGAA